MRPRKYHVTLTKEEHEYLIETTTTGRKKAYRIRHANILLRLEEAFN